MTIEAREYNPELAMRAMSNLAHQLPLYRDGKIKEEKWGRTVGVALAVGNKVAAVASTAGMSPAEVRALAARIGVVGLD